jgi:hypothetical protein
MPDRFTYEKSCYSEVFLYLTEITAILVDSQG